MLSSTIVPSLLSRLSPLRSRFTSASSHAAASFPVSFSGAFRHAAAAGDATSGRRAHALMVSSGFVPSPFVSNCLLHMYSRCGDLASARHVFDQMPHRDAVSWNTMASSYARAGDMGAARALFDAAPSRDAVSWNTIISGYVQSGSFDCSLDMFLQMVHSGVSPDATTFAVVLKACAALESFTLGVLTHGLAVKLCLDDDVMTGSAIVDMYGKCGLVKDALRFFDRMPVKNLVSWSAVIAGCVQNEWHSDGLRHFVSMLRSGGGASQSAYASVLRACAALSCSFTGGQLHAHALKADFGLDPVVGTAIVDMYAKAGEVDDAMSAFRRLPALKIESCNALVVGLVREGQASRAIDLFRLAVESGLRINEISLSGVFSACAEIKDQRRGSQVHALVVKVGHGADICVSNAILDLYGKCAGLPEACQVFNEMLLRDAVSWNAIITALEQNGWHEDTLSRFGDMLRHGMEPDEFTYGSVLKACTALRSLAHGVEVHVKIIKSGLGTHPFVSAAVVDMYCKCGSVEEADKIHSRSGKHGAVSWNAMISGCTLQKQSEEGQEWFSKMLDEGAAPDRYTYSTVLDTCADLATVGLGRQIHGQIIKLDLHRDVYVGSTLVDMYAKCGLMVDSLQVFEHMPQRDFVSWNALICGYALHGHGATALAVFDRMQSEGLSPNRATFTSVLRACCHVGLFDDGVRYFELMTGKYNLEPEVEHFACMVDIIGRSKGTLDALRLITTMPLEPDVVIWKTLLGVCRIRRDIETAELAARNVVQLDPDDSSAYVLLSNMYAESGMWSEVSRMRRTMRRGRLKKAPGCSWTEVENEMHAFFIGDKAHPRAAAMYEMLDELTAEMRRSGYVPDRGVLNEDDEDDDEAGGGELPRACSG